MQQPEPKTDIKSKSKPKLEPEPEPKHWSDGKKIPIITTAVVVIAALCAWLFSKKEVPFDFDEKYQQEIKSLEK